MTDSLSTILSKGWTDLKANPVLIIPGILTMIFVYLFVYAVFFALFGDLVPLSSVIGSNVVDPAYFESIAVESAIESNIGQFFAVFFIGLIVLLLIAVFISAGLTGMGKEAVTTGSTKMGDFWSYGKKYFIKILLLSLIIGVIFVFVFFVVFVLALLFGLLIATSGSVGFALILYLFFMLAFTVIALLILLVTYFASYAIVLENYGVFDSLQKSYRLFADNKGDVFTFVLAMIVINLIVSLIIQAVALLFGYIPSIGFYLAVIFEIILMALMTSLVTVWAVRKYYDLVSDRTAAPPSEGKYGEYRSIEEGILDSDGNVVEDFYEEVVIEK